MSSLVLLLLQILVPTATGSVLVSFCFHPPLQDHLLRLAGPLLLQHLAAGLCPPSEAAGAAAPAHLGHPPAGDVPEAAVVGPTAARAPAQPVCTHAERTLTFKTRAVRFAGQLDRLSIAAVEQISSATGDWLVWLLLPASQQRWLDGGGTGRFSLDYVAAGCVRATAGVG